MTDSIHLFFTSNNFGICIEFCRRFFLTKLNWRNTFSFIFKKIFFSLIDFFYFWILWSQYSKKEVIQMNFARKSRENVYIFCVEPSMFNLINMPFGESIWNPNFRSATAWICLNPLFDDSDPLPMWLWCAQCSLQLLQKFEVQNALNDFKRAHCVSNEIHWMVS